MIFTERSTVQTGAIPRVWLPVSTPPRSSQEQREDAALLQQLSLLCANSYDSRKRNAVKYFLTDNELDYATHRRAFGRDKGRPFWRPLALVLMPINYLVILVWFLALMVPLIGGGALAESLLESLTGLPLYFFRWLTMTSPVWLCWFALFSVGLGVVVGAIITVAPRLASGRAFGLVDPSVKRALVVFRGSEPYDNLTINTLVWPYLGPLRHLGFHRAWGHIGPEIRQWLKDGVSEGQVREVVITGHSLGGALAQIAAFDLAGEFPVRHVISLGSACIGGGGMREQFARREVAGGGRLHERTRHFTYTGDVMPRIPPMSIFRQVGRRLRLPDRGGPTEGIEAGLLQSFGAFFVDRMSFFALLFMETVTKIRAVIKKIMSPLLASNSAFSAVLPVQEHRMTGAELFDYVFTFIRMFPATIPFALFVTAIALTAFPLIVLCTLYWYYARAFYTGLKVQHAAHNYRDALEASEASPGFVAAAVS